MSTLKTNRIENLTTSDGGISINNSGQIGIGTSSAAETVHVQKNTGAKIFLGTGTSPADSAQGLDFYGRFVNGTTPALPGQLTSYIREERQGSGSSFELTFGTATTSDATERMRIDSSGNFGIGTSSPTAPLHVQNNDNSPGGTIQHWVADTGTFVRTVSLLAPETDNTNAPFTFFTGNAWNFRVDTTDALTINSAGNVGIRTTSPSTTLDVNGSFSKNSGSFKIDHPLPALTETHHLVHSFVEAPDASNLYAGMVDLVDGTATVNIDTAHRMTEGTFEALNTLQSWSSSNESGYAPVKCSVSGNILTIECQDSTSTDTVYYEVRGIRKDQHMLDTEWTDSSGKVITEPLKPVSP